MSSRDPIELFGLLDPFVDESFTEEDEARLLRIIETPVCTTAPRSPGRCCSSPPAARS